MCEELRKMVSPIIPFLEAVKDLEYEVEARVTAANRNPATGFEFARGEPLAAVEWPQCVADEQAGFAARETLAQASRSPSM